MKRTVEEQARFISERFGARARKVAETCYRDKQSTQEGRNYYDAVIAELDRLAGVGVFADPDKVEPVALNWETAPVVPISVETIQNYRDTLVGADGADEGFDMARHRAASWSGWWARASIALRGRKLDPAMLIDAGRRAFEAGVGARWWAMTGEERVPADPRDASALGVELSRMTTVDAVKRMIVPWGLLKTWTRELRAQGRGQVTLSRISYDVRSRPRRLRWPTATIPDLGTVIADGPPSFRPSWGTTGRAQSFKGRIIISCGRDLGDALVTILHEIAHIVAPLAEGHGAIWKRIYAAATTEVTGIDIPLSGINLISKGDLDLLCRQALCTWLQISAEHPF